MTRCAIAQMAESSQILNYRFYLNLVLKIKISLKFNCFSIIVDTPFYKDAAVRYDNSSTKAEAKQ
jgi:hypothetical protein